MDQTFEEALGQLLYENTMNESSMSSDVAKWEPLLFPLIKKIYPNSLVEQIASVQATKSPLAKISYLNAIYTGDTSNIENNVHWTNSRLMTVAISSAASIVKGQVYQINTVPVTFAQVHYTETSSEFVTTEVSSGLTKTQSVSAVPKYHNILVAAISGSLDTSNAMYGVTAGNTINGVSILYTTTNKNTIKKVFKDYSTVLEANTNLREVNFEPATKVISTTSRKIRSKFSQEKLQDLKALYNEKAYDLVAEAVANEIRQEIDREVITYLKQISTPMLSDINLPASLANYPSGSMGDITYDLYGSIFLAAEEIVKATKRNRTMFILADSATVAFLLLNPLHSQAKAEDGNPYKVGKVGMYDLYCDPFSTEHYVLIGYDYTGGDKNDAGLYFCPYTTTVHEVESGYDAAGTSPFSTNFMVMNRYGFTNHPQDSGTGNGDSDFFRLFSVNFAQIGQQLIPNFPEQFRTAY